MFLMFLGILHVIWNFNNTNYIEVYSSIALLVDLNGLFLQICIINVTMFLELRM